MLRVQEIDLLLQMRDFGGMISFELKNDSVEEARREFAIAERLHGDVK